MDSRVLRLRIERADETVRRVVAGLMHHRGVTAAELADGVGIPLLTLERRLRASGSSYAFTAGEVLALSEYFGIEGETLFHYMDRQYHPPNEWAPARQGQLSVAPQADAPHPQVGEIAEVEETRAGLEAGMAIGRAQGVLMEVHQLTGAEALAAITACAGREGLSALAVAQSIVDTGRLPDSRRLT